MTLSAQLRELAGKATSGDLTTAERHTLQEWVECPFCQGEGEVSATDYCNFDSKALGVQFYGIGSEFGAHEKLWSALTANLETIIAALELQEVQRGPANGVNCSNCGCRLPANYTSVCPDCGCGELQALKGGSQ